MSSLVARKGCVRGACGFTGSAAVVRTVDVALVYIPTWEVCESRSGRREIPVRVGFGGVEHVEGSGWDE